MPSNNTAPLKGTISVPGDKSISHRAIMFASISEGTTYISNFLNSADSLSTISCFKEMGIHIEQDISQNSLCISGKGLYGLREPDKILDVGNSGTTIRLLSGLLSGQDFSVTITGDHSIQSRPMGRVIKPLSLMGGNIRSIKDNDCAPLIINESSDKAGLKGIDYKSPVASAQVKSCVLLAGMYAEGQTSVTEPSLSRNHTELMIGHLGGKIKVDGNTTTIFPKPKLKGTDISVPGDISSAAYFIVAGLIVPNSEILLKDVGINPTRDGIIHVCKRMGANINIENKRYFGQELVADIVVKHSELNEVEIGGDIIPTLIDEIPIIAILACFAKGKTLIRDAAELKVKESNRIDLIVDNLSRMGADIEATEDGMIINGGKPLHGALIDSQYDHRIAMSFAIADLMADGESKILHPECIDVSYPDFYEDLESLR